jgi:hypothetical protein
VEASASMAQISSRGCPAKLRRLASADSTRGTEQEGGHESLLRVVGSGLGGDGVAERPLALVEHFQDPAGQHRAADDHLGEARSGKPDRDAGPGDRLRTGLSWPIA